MDGEKFRLHKLLANDVARWVCTEKRCLAYRKIDVTGVVLAENLEHNHEPQEESKLFLLLDALLEVQDMSYIKMRTPPAANDPRTPKEIFVAESMAKWDVYEIDRFEFVKLVSRKFLPNKLK